LPVSRTHKTSRADADDLLLIKNAVKEAGGIALKGFHAVDTEVWDKEKGHPVTQTDIDVNDYLQRVLMQARPDYGWLSEETKDDKSRHDCNRTFVVDPIDGTRAFIDRSPNFAVSVAIIEAGQPVVAALYNPLKDELYTAQTGHGAFLNGKLITTSTCNHIKDCRMVGYPRKFRRLGWPDMNVSVVNSMAYRMCIVASEIRFDEEKTSNLGVICAGPNLQPLLVEQVKPLIDAFYKSDNKVRDFSHLGTRPEDRQEKKRMQLLHLVIGGELVDPMKTEFKDLSNIDFIGAFPNYAAARDAWKSAAQRTVDNAHMRYFVLHAHELIDPDKDGFIG